MQIKIYGIDLDVDIDYRYSGFRMTAQIYDLDGWQIVQEFGGELRIMQTPFEALADLTSELFGSAGDAEIIAEQMGIPFRFYEDEDCVKCDFFGNADEMAEDVDGNPICLDCAEYAIN